MKKIFLFLAFACLASSQGLAQTESEFNFMNDLMQQSPANGRAELRASNTGLNAWKIKGFQLIKGDILGMTLRKMNKLNADFSESLILIEQNDKLLYVLNNSGAASTSGIIKSFCSDLPTGNYDLTIVTKAEREEVYVLTTMVTSRRNSVNMARYKGVPIFSMDWSLQNKTEVVRVLDVLHNVQWGDAFNLSGSLFVPKVSSTSTNPAFNIVED